ncbi:hypothetical protein N8J89_16820 [Crossiella sp. CA-258035]|uniref:hypothetical protein n=1 Tax=Crossiella sp. CA-258035 TaxID=2981138 RepID=UPI0024BC9629|nr:hypothetical protein [Crossiella sp. CA-258035]WHT22661.1 hypothetical protein N8J89_16820 [Crossiella sp. CA-258035]
MIDNTFAMVTFTHRNLSSLQLNASRACGTPQWTIVPTLETGASFARRALVNLFLDQPIQVAFWCEHRKSHFRETG